MNVRFGLEISSRKHVGPCFFNRSAVHLRCRISLFQRFDETLGALGRADQLTCGLKHELFAQFMLRSPCACLYCSGQLPVSRQDNKKFSTPKYQVPQVNVQVHLTRRRLCPADLEQWYALLVFRMYLW